MSEAAFVEWEIVAFTDDVRPTELRGREGVVRAFPTVEYEQTDYVIDVIGLCCYCVEPQHLVRTGRSTKRSEWMTDEHVTVVVDRSGRGRRG